MRFPNPDKQHWTFGEYCAHFLAQVTKSKRRLFNLWSLPIRWLYLGKATAAKRATLLTPTSTWVVFMGACELLNPIPKIFTRFSYLTRNGALTLPFLPSLVNTLDAQEIFLRMLQSGRPSDIQEIRIPVLHTHQCVLVSTWVRVQQLQSNSTRF